MQSSIILALALLFGACSCSLADSDFLRISVECPDLDGNGVLETIDEKPNGSESRVSTSYIGGQVDQVTVAVSEDGATFKNRFTLGRAASAGTKEFPAFRAFEDRANELLRFFCLAEPAAKQRYLDLLQANRALLHQQKAP
jgi:hypothetical protein